MILLLLFNSVQFYVLAAVVAAAVVACCVKPSIKGEARTWLLAGTLCATDSDSSAAPAIDVRCMPDGKVMLTRRGLSGMTSGGAVSLAVTVAGFDISVEERVVTAIEGEPVDTALFTLDFLGRERYHLRYNSESTGLFVAFTLPVRPDMVLHKPLAVRS